MNEKIRSSNEIKDERYPRGYFRRLKLDGTKTSALVYCGRNRCDETILLFQSVDGVKYPYDTVVISLDDGDNRYAFHNATCAALWLTAYKNKRPKG